jgi:transcriptional regulator with PAS, ATPase and Fis domain
MVIKKKSQDRRPDETPVSDRKLRGWNLSLLSDELLEWAGVGVTILDPGGNVLYYNRWAAENLDRKPEYLGHDVRNRHRRPITNPRFDAMLALFEEGRTEPVRYVARPYGKTTILVTVSPIIVAGRISGYSQIVLLKDEVQELCRRFDESGRNSFEQEMLGDVP